MKSFKTAKMPGGTKIVLGNNKLQSVPNISLAPIRACPKNAPCFKTCYALKFYHRPSVKACWDGNLEIAQKRTAEYFADVRLFLERKPRFFRWHVSGDILSQAYLSEMMAIARENPNTKFLAFTKKYDLDYAEIPKNLSIVFSAWPGWPLPEADLPIAFMQDGTEDRVDGTEIECQGNCEHCGMCWDLGSLDRNVVFHKH